MKKIAAIILVLILLLSFCGCNSTKLTSKNLVGSWETEISVEVYSAISDDDLSAKFTENDIPKSLANEIGALKLKTIFEFDKGKGNLKIPEEAVKNFSQETIGIIIDYYKNGGLLKAVQEQGIEINTNEELDEIYKEEGTSIDAILTEMRAKMEKVINDNSDDLMTGQLVDGYYPLYEIKPKYRIDEDTVIFYDSYDEYETFYFEIIDNDTLKINKIYYNYEEFNVSMTLKRVK